VLVDLKNHNNNNNKNREFANASQNGDQGANDKLFVRVSMNETEASDFYFCCPDISQRARQFIAAVT